MVVAGGAAATAADVAADEDVDVELLLLFFKPASPITISTPMTAKIMTHLGIFCFFWAIHPLLARGQVGAPRRVTPRPAPGPAIPVAASRT